METSFENDKYKYNNNVEKLNTPEKGNSSFDNCYLNNKDIDINEAHALNEIDNNSIDINDNNYNNYKNIS